MMTNLRIYGWTIPLRPEVCYLFWCFWNSENLKLKLWCWNLGHYSTITLKMLSIFVWTLTFLDPYKEIWSKIWLTSLLSVRQYTNYFSFFAVIVIFFSLKGSKCFKRLQLSCFSSSSARLHRVLTECAVLLIHSRFSVNGLCDPERSFDVLVQMF